MLASWYAQYGRQGYDVIVGQGTLIVSAADGIHQSGYQPQAVASTLARLSKIPIE